MESEEGRSELENVRSRERKEEKRGAREIKRGDRRERIEEEETTSEENKRKTGIEGEKMKERERWIKRDSKMNLKLD